MYNEGGQQRGSKGGCKRVKEQEKGKKRGFKREKERREGN